MYTYIYIYIMDYNGLWSKPHVTELYYTNISHPLVCPSISRGKHIHCKHPPAAFWPRIISRCKCLRNANRNCLSHANPGENLTQLERMARYFKVICRYFESWRVLCNFYEVSWDSYREARYHGILFSCLFFYRIRSVALSHFCLLFFAKKLLLTDSCGQ